jgi:hypothetical protein
MSVLADRTERKALKAIAKTLRFFDELVLCRITAQDDEAIVEAKRLLSGVLENGGYRAVYERRKGTRLIKQRI